MSTSSPRPLLVQFHVGEVVTSLQRTTLVPGGAEVLLYSTINGSIGALLPFKSRWVVCLEYRIMLLCRLSVSGLLRGAGTLCIVGGLGQRERGVPLSNARVLVKMTCKVIFLAWCHGRFISACF